LVPNAGDHERLKIVVRGPAAIGRCHAKSELSTTIW
jgi:hypothetical protein